MTEAFLLPETNLREAGAGPELCLGEAGAGLLNVTVRITRATERESLEVSIWGSSNGVEWGSQPLAKLPRRFYCGTYHSAIDLSGSSTKYLKAQWRVDRWASGGEKPLFTMAMSVRGIGPGPAIADREATASATAALDCENLNASFAPARKRTERFWIAMLNHSLL